MQAYLLDFSLAGLGLVLLLWEAFCPPVQKKNIGIAGAIGLTAIFLVLQFANFSPDTDQWLERFYHHDGKALFFKSFALIATILVLLMSFDFAKILNRFTSLDNSNTNTGEFYFLPVFTCAGFMWLASSIDLVSIFVSLELVTISFYVLVAFMRRNVGSLEAGVKYLITGALSTGILVYGIAWLYGATQATSIEGITLALTNPDLHKPTLLFGLALIILSIGFKVGAAPMQLWIPDVYQGAPSPIAAYLSVASKAAGFGVGITILAPFLASDVTRESVSMVLFIMAGTTLLIGNFAAIAQTNFKRLLAYSSIAHAGFIMLGLASGDYSKVAFYLATYLVMTFTAFFILGLIRVQEDSDEMEVFRGLAKRNPILALTLTINLAAMAGMPLTVGFWGKLFMLQDAIAFAPLWVILAAIIGGATAFYYYFKLIKIMYWEAPEKDTKIVLPVISRTVISIFTIATIVFGFTAQPILNMIQF